MEGMIFKNLLLFIDFRLLKSVSKFSAHKYRDENEHLESTLQIPTTNCLCVDGTFQPAHKTISRLSVNVMRVHYGTELMPLETMVILQRLVLC